MSEMSDMIETAYGRVDRIALRAVQDTYDTTALLSMVDKLDALLVRVREEDGLRDMLLCLHGMAHSVINGAGFSVPANEESLPELAFDISAEILQIILMLQEWRHQLEPLEQLAPRN
jgi:hypothetical protein